ncbi:hypothetical protein CHRYSEOSP005_00180 [Chryseobacterium sp. Alg-005]|uniref:hypothetical protein n=1 Tax=Chryseobacterium sp. Alg-005 TaxID=3159516 RepID=UPI003555A712
MSEKDTKPKLNFQDKHEALDMAIKDFDQFCRYAGIDTTQLKVCIERNKGLTMGQISQKLNVPKSTVRNICERCFD